MPRSKGGQMKKDMEKFRGPPKERLTATIKPKKPSKAPAKKWKPSNVG